MVEMRLLLLVMLKNSALQNNSNVLLDRRDTSLIELVDYNESIAQEILLICKPLFKKYNIGVFEYSRYFNDGTLIHLSTHLRWHKEFLYQYAGSPLVVNHLQRLFSQKYQYHVWDTECPVEKCDARMAFIKNRRRLNIWHDFTFYKHHENSLESFSFAAKKQNALEINFYLNYRDSLHGFTMFFVEQAGKIIDTKNCKKVKIASENFLINYDKMKEIEIEKEKRKSFLDEIRLSEYKLMTPNGFLYLSRRELQCLSFKSRGKTSKEIANQLKIGFRTVQGYIHSLSKKARALGLTLTRTVDLFLASSLNDLSLKDL